MKQFGTAERECRDEVDAPEPPTVRVPKRSPVRIALVQVASAFARIDEVVADLARDPRSEYCSERASGPALVGTEVVVPRIAPLRAPNLRTKRQR